MTKSITQDVHDEVMEYISFELPKEMPEPKSVIILAIGNPPQSEPHLPMEMGNQYPCLPGVLSQGI